jgi:hypothetical protein
LQRRQLLSAVRYGFATILTRRFEALGNFAAIIWPIILNWAIYLPLCGGMA